MDNLNYVAMADPYLKRLLWFLLVGTRGGENRSRVLNLLKSGPFNANQIAETLRLDYKTVQHHLKVLRQHNLISSTENGYGSTFSLSPFLTSQIEIFDEIWGKLERGERIERPRRLHI